MNQTLQIAIVVSIGQKRKQEKNVGNTEGGQRNKVLGLGELARSGNKVFIEAGYLSFLLFTNSRHNGRVEKYLI